MASVTQPLAGYRAWHPCDSTPIELHYPLAVSEVQIWDTLDALTHDNFRLFSVEPNVHSGFATHYLEFSFIKVSPDGHVCVPRPASEGKVGLPLGCARQ